MISIRLLNLNLVNNIEKLIALAILTAISTTYAEKSYKKVEATSIGIMIVGHIIQKQIDDNVALIKVNKSSLKAVKKGHIIDKKYKVVKISEKGIYLVSRKREYIFASQFKLKNNANSSKNVASSSKNDINSNFYSEDGFERSENKITMTAMYRDKIANQDLSSILMQATAEPYMENGKIAGFVVSQIDNNSIYQKAGIKNNDIIKEINGQPLDNIAASISLLKTLKGASNISFDIMRDGRVQTMNVDIN